MADQPAANKKADEPASTRITKWLAGGLTFVTGAVGVIGVEDGTLEEVVRNHPTEAIICFGLVLVGVGLGVIGPAVSGGIPDWVLFPGALLLLGPVMYLGYLAAVETSTAKRPRVSADLVPVSDSRKTVEVTGNVTVTGLRSNQYMVIRVEGRTTASELALLHTGPPRGDDDPVARSGTLRGDLDYYQSIYAVRVGPDEDGTVDTTVNAEVPRRLYERVVVSGQLAREADAKEQISPTVRRCARAAPFWGCAVIAMPERVKAGR